MQYILETHNLDIVQGILKLYMENLLKAIQKALDGNIFVEHNDENGRAWQIGALKLDLITKNRIPISKKLVSDLNFFGFEYIGERQDQVIFRRRMYNGQKSDDFKSLQEFYEANF